MGTARLNCVYVPSERAFSGVFVMIASVEQTSRHLDPANLMPDELSGFHDVNPAAIFWGCDNRTKYNYDVYGARTASAEAVPTKWGFTGRVHEKDAAGEIYYRARELDNETGRFTARDPLHESFILPHAYEYAFSSPTFNIDPTGLLAVILMGPKTEVSVLNNRLQWNGWSRPVDSEQLQPYIHDVLLYAGVIPSDEWRSKVAIVQNAGDVFIQLVLIGELEAEPITTVVYAGHALFGYGEYYAKGLAPIQFSNINAFSLANAIGDALGRTLPNPVALVACKTAPIFAGALASELQAPVIGMTTVGTFAANFDPIEGHIRYLTLMNAEFETVGP